MWQQSLDAASDSSSDDDELEKDAGGGAGGSAASEPAPSHHRRASLGYCAGRPPRIVRAKQARDCLTQDSDNDEGEETGFRRKKP